MSYFRDDEKMYVPLSIDTVEARRGNYFFSNKKMLYAFFAFIPIFALLTPLVRVGVGLFPIMVIVVIYMLGYIYFLRYVVLEEKRLRRMLRELDDNRVSEVDHFWGIDKIGSGEEDNGMIYYAYKGAAKGITSGLVVMLERGSMVGVPEGHYDEYRKTMQKFYRSLHINEMYPTVIEIQKQPELQESLVDYADILSRMDNEYHRKLLKLNLSINSIYTMGKEQRYVEYFIVKRDGFNHNFKRTLETIIEDTFGYGNHIKEAKILDKKEVEDFYKNYLQVDTLDSSNIRKSVESKPFENYALVHRLLDELGKEVPIQLLDDLDIDKYSGKSIDRMVNDLTKKEEQEEAKRIKMLETEMKKLNQKRNRDLMTHEEYSNEKNAIDEKYSKENFAKMEDIQKENKRDKRRRRNKLEDNKTTEVKEYDLNSDEGNKYIRGNESIDELVERDTNKGKKGGIFGRYKK